MKILWSPSTGGFYHSALNAGDIPADAVAVSRRRHAELLAARGAGRTIRAGAGGRPELEPLRKPSLEQLRASAVMAAKREASRRILAVASLERQSNDAAAMAMRVLDPPLWHSPGGEAEIAAALARRRLIDAIRAASNALEATIAGMPASNLINFNAGEDPRWPAQD